MKHTITDIALRLDATVDEVIEASGGAHDLTFCDLCEDLLARSCHILSQGKFLLGPRKVVEVERFRMGVVAAVGTSMFQLVRLEELLRLPQTLTHDPASAIAAIEPPADPSLACAVFVSVEHCQRLDFAADSACTPGMIGHCRSPIQIGHSPGVLQHPPGLFSDTSILLDSTDIPLSALSSKGYVRIALRAGQASG